MVTEAEIDAANRRGAKARSGPIVTAARYDAQSGRIVLSLSTGFEITFLPAYAEGTDKATAEQLENIEISPSGLGIYFPDVDADLSVPGILAGVMGTRNWMAARIGGIGGAATTDAKKAAARANGTRGGRPPKEKIAV